MTLRGQWESLKTELDSLRDDSLCVRSDFANVFRAAAMLLAERAEPQRACFISSCLLVGHYFDFEGVIFHRILKAETGDDQF